MVQKYMLPRMLVFASVTKRGSRQRSIEIGQVYVCHPKFVVINGEAVLWDARSEVPLQWFFVGIGDYVVAGSASSNPKAFCANLHKAAGADSILGRRSNMFVVVQLVNSIEHLWAVAGVDA